MRLRTGRRQDSRQHLSENEIDRLPEAMARGEHQPLRLTISLLVELMLTSVI
jgi:hypothetical protein